MNIGTHHKERAWPVRLTGDTPDGSLVLEEPMSAQAAAKIITENCEPVTWLDWKHRGSALFITGSYEAGLKAARKAVGLHRSPATLLDLAVILEGFGRFEEALELEREAREMEPANCFVGCIYANSLLRQGRFDEAWPIWECYGWHRGADIELAHYIPLWEGDDLAGKRILVLHAGGFGDQILFFRWFRQLRVAGAHITFVCPDVMLPLLEGHPWIDKLLGTHETLQEHVSPMASNKLDQIPEVDLEPSNFDCFISILNLGPLIAPTLSHFWMGPYIHGSRVSGPGVVHKSVSARKPAKCSARGGIARLKILRSSSSWRSMAWTGSVSTLKPQTSNPEVCATSHRPGIPFQRSRTGSTRRGLSLASTWSSRWTLAWRTWPAQWVSHAG
jgi:hypothetical protein